MISKEKRFPQARQAGMTTVGMVLLVSVIGLIAFAGLRLTPVYLNYIKVAGVVNGVVDEFDGQSASTAAIRKYISRRFGVEDVREIEVSDIKVKAVDGGYEVRAKYDHTAPFISNVSFTVHFDKMAMVRK